MASKNSTLKPRLSWDDIARRAIRHAKKNPYAPEYVVKGLHWRNAATALKARKSLGGKPLYRWQIVTTNRSTKEPGKCQIILTYFTKETRGIRWQKPDH